MSNDIPGRPGPLGPGYGPGHAPATAGQPDALPFQEAAGNDRARSLWVFAATGAVATAVPAVPGLALAAAGDPHAALLLICSGAIAAISVIAGAVVRIYDIAQRTRRLQIQCAGPNAIAAAMAKCIDDTHATAQDVPAGQHAAEAASVRASAATALTEMMPAMLAALEQQIPRPAGLNAAPGRRRRALP
jgi:hypothetical protein